jgi:hypothetical protein
MNYEQDRDAAGAADRMFNAPGAFTHLAHNYIAFRRRVLV